MITEEQQKWLDHLSNTDKVSIVPWDPSSEDQFLKIKKQVQNILGINQRVEHRGASSLKISGQDEIDIYIPVPKENFNDTVDRIETLFGKPRSFYPYKRTRFATLADKKHIDVFVINENDDNWKNSEIFHNYLLSHPVIIDEYRKLKEGANGTDVRAYYTAKIKFINNILTLAGNNSIDPTSRL